VSFPFNLHSAAVFDSHMPCHDHAVLKRRLKATAQRGMRTEWYMWISIGRPEMACGRPARFLLLPATTQSPTNVVTRSRLAVRIFPSTTRTFTKDTVLSENGRSAARHVWINAVGERHGVCELAFKGPEDSTRLRLSDFEKFGAWRWKGRQSYAPASFTSPVIFLVLIYKYIKGSVDLRALVRSEWFQWQHWESNPRPYGL
jgi:hypothetical protein